MIQTKAFDEAEREFAAKVDGTTVLESLLADAPLDFWVSCSSYVSATGGFGQVAYSAACAFQDHWAEARARRFPACKVLSIDWERWRNLGMVVAFEQRHRELTGATMAGGMSVEQGLEVFARLLSGADMARILVSMRDFMALLKQSRTHPLGRFAAASKPQAAHGRPRLDNSYVAPAGETECALADIWQQELGIDRIGVLDDFFALGGDSLLAAKLALRMRQALALPITLKTLYDAPTVRALAGFAESLRWAANVPAGSDEDEEEGIL